MSVLLAYLEEALASVWRNRVRSILTILGMIIGSASIIAVFGISRAATTGITSTFESFGSFPDFINPDPSQVDPATAAIHYRDDSAVAAALGDSILTGYPSWTRTYQVAFGNTRDYENIQSFMGTNLDTLAMSEGRKIDQDDVDSGASVCVLTSDIARKYFGSNPAVGNYLRIKGARCEVVGVYADAAGSFGNAINSSTIYVPYTTMYNQFAPGDVDGLVVYPADKKQSDAVGKLAVAALKHIHGQRAEYQAQNGAGFIEGFDSALNIIAVGLSAIGGVALLVAGIGIMNIMLVSVTERTREIGIRKAIGASRTNIILQFLMEAIVLSIVGGGIGMGIGILATVGAVSILSKTLGVMIIPYLLIVSIALGFSIAVGMLFGTYPAVRAANLDPIEALRGA